MYVLILMLHVIVLMLHVLILMLHVVILMLLLYNSNIMMIIVIIKVAGWSGCSAALSVRIMCDSSAVSCSHHTHARPTVSE